MSSSDLSKPTRLSGSHIVERRSDWQIAQAAKCGCRGSDELCACQNENAPWRYGLAPYPKAPFAQTWSPQRDHHEVRYHFPTAAAARFFRDQVARLWQPEPLPAGGMGTDQANDSTVTSQSPKPDRMERSAISPSSPPTIRPDTGDA